jgi:hypothetical protein
LRGAATGWIVDGVKLQHNGGNNNS